MELQKFFVLIPMLLGVGLAAKLGTYNIDHSQISTSGLSAGAFMAVQMHIAHSKMFIGVGILAGGPYWCAKNNLITATTTCMVTPYSIDVSALLQKTRDFESLSVIDPLENLANDRVYIFSGESDTVVVKGVVEKAEQYYSELLPVSNIKAVYTINSQHGFPTDNYGGQCDRLNTEYINKCNYDGAYKALGHIHGGQEKLQKPQYPITNLPGGSIIEFDQTEFFTVGLFGYSGLDDVGYMYVPDACADNTMACSLHVAFHGCKQGAEYLGQTYVTKTGYNEVAALNNFIIIYPQAKKDLINNPNGCFDWWGYTGSDYAKKGGLQVEAVKQMVERVAGM